MGTSFPLEMFLATSPEEQDYGKEKEKEKKEKALDVSNYWAIKMHKSVRSNWQRWFIWGESGGIRNDRKVGRIRYRMLGRALSHFAGTR